MKMNLFVVNSKKDASETNLHDARGHLAVDVIDPEAEMIQEIDEEKTRPDKLIAQKFLSFLGNRHLTLATINQTPITEQRRIRKEFLETV